MDRTMHGMVSRTALVLLAAYLFAPAPSFAFKVYSPIVIPGETVLEFWGEATGEGSSGGTKQAENKRLQAEVRHTFFDRLDLGAALVAESGANMSTGNEEGIGFSRVKLHGLYQITEKNSHFADFGLYADYQKIQGTLQTAIPDYLNVMLLMEKDFESCSLGLNPGVRKTLSYVIGKKDNVGTYQAAFKYRYHPLFNPGIEIQGIDLGPLDSMLPFDQQKHNGGPVFSGQLPPFAGYTVRYFGSVLFGMTTASTGVIVSGVLEIGF